MAPLLVALNPQKPVDVAKVTQGRGLGNSGGAASMSGLVTILKP